MPILDLQRSLRQIGRIRLGQQVATSSGARRPAKLESFRFTSADDVAIKSAAALFGGEPQRWKDAPIGDQWEVITDAAVLPVVIPPASTAYSAWYEQWSGGGCLRRCDGETEMLSDQPCLCASEDERVCAPHTRLNVILADLPGLGVWRLDTQGWYAARELAGVVEVITGAATRGRLLPATLRLEQRQTKRIVDGKAQTRKFAVPVLDVQMTPSALGLVVGSPPSLMDPATGELPPTGAWQPIPQPELGPAPAEDVGDAIRNAGGPGPRRTKRSAPELPPTGVNPRGMGRDDAPPLPDPPPDPSRLSDAQMRKLRALYGAIGVTSSGEQKRATALILGVDEIATHSDLTPEQASTVIDRLTAVAAGFLEFERDDHGVIVGIRQATEVTDGR